MHLNVKRPNTIGRKISKEKKSNSRDKFITFSGCDTELKHLIDIITRGQLLDKKIQKISPYVAAFSNWFIITSAVDELFE